MMMSKFSQHSAAVVLSIFSLSHTPAWAAEGEITMNVLKAEAVVGASGGGGVLLFEGIEYPLVVSGLSIGASVALADVTMSGTASNLQSPADIEGSYTAIGAGAALVLGAGASVTFENQNGVRLDVVAVEVGFDLSLDLSEMTIALE